MTIRRAIVVPHTHWDREWYRTRESFRFRLIGLLDALLDQLERDPAFRHFTLDGQTIVLRDYLEVRPQARERIARLVSAGRLLIGPWTVLPDEWLVSGEALVRNLRLGLADAEAFGGAMRVGYVPDQFGHVGQLPQLFAGFGFDAAVLWRGVGADVGETLFRWQAPDGTTLLAVYLIRGYGNGAHLPGSGPALAARIREELRALAPHTRVDAALVMNGSDHLAPRPDLPQALVAAAPLLPDVTLSIGTLPEYLAWVREELPAGLPLHRGELRSGLRAPLLAGCASSRMPQKRADFANDRLLTRYLEPLSAWLSRVGGRSDPQLIELVWRIALENHPHDSICGCSIDAVHDEMDVRFARVADLAGSELLRVGRALAAHVRPVPGEGHPVWVWNPHGTGRALAEGELELPFEGREGERVALVARDESGAAHAAEASILREARRYADYRLPATVVAQLLRGFPPEFFGDPVCAARRVDDARGERVEVWLGETPPPGFDWERERDALADAVAREGDRTLGFRPLRLPRLRVSLSDRFPGAGLRTYRLHAAPGTQGDDPALRAGRAGGTCWIENAAWRVEVDETGAVRCLHRPSGCCWDDAVALVDEGDRGDSYSFDPVEEPPVIRRHDVRVALAAASPLRAEIQLHGTLRVPAELAADRRRRDARCVPLPFRLDLGLVRDLDRLDLRVRVENGARDHRLRLRLRAPFAPHALEVESAFEIAERPLAAATASDPRPAELPSDVSPQRRFATLRGTRHALTVATRGLAEVGAVPGAEGGAGGGLAVTLLRAVGWLSRDDLVRRPQHAGPPLPVPGAQVPGPHEAELAVFLHEDGVPERIAAALRFADPPLLLGGAPHAAGPLSDGARLVEIDDPAVALSALEPRPDGAVWLRVVNLAPEPRRLPLVWHGGGPGLAPIDLAGRPLGETAAQTVVTLRAGQIACWSAPAPGRHPGAQPLAVQEANAPSR